MHSGTRQGLGSTVLILLVMALAFLFDMEVGGTILVVVITAVVLGLALFLAWLISKLFNIDFYVAYQIMTFVGCFMPNNKK